MTARSTTLTRQEIVRVSQYAVLGSMGLSLTDIKSISNFDNMIEYHAYDFQHKILGDTNGLDVVNDFQNIQYYNSMNYTNFNWTNNTKFTYPITK